MRSIKKSSRTCVVRDELAERVGSLFCGKATAVAACHRHAAKSRLSNPTRARVIMPEKSPSGWMGFFLAERVGFEPTVPLPVHLISSQGRYNHFDTTPYELALVLYQQARAKSRGFLRKSGECFLGHGKSGKSFVFLLQKRCAQTAHFLWKHVRNFRCKFPFSVL